MEELSLEIKGGRTTRYNQFVVERVVHSIDDAAAEDLLKQLEQVVEQSYARYSEQVQKDIDLIRQEIQASNKSATAKLKVALPIIPKLAHLELEIDVENFGNELWLKIQSLFKQETKSPSGGLSHVRPAIKQKTTVDEETESAGDEDRLFSDEFIQQDQKFIEDVKTHLRSDLKRSELFVRELIGGWGVHSITDIQLHDFLVWMCEQGQFDEIVVAADEALCECQDRLPPLSPEETLTIREVAKNVVAKLALLNVRQQWLLEQQQREANASPPGMHLPGFDWECVELLVSRRHQLIPDFSRVSKQGLMNGRKKGSLVDLEMGARKETTIDLIIKTISELLLEKRILSHEKPEDVREKLQIYLEIQGKYTKLKKRRRFFILIPDAEIEHSALHDENIQKELQRLFPQLGWVTIRAGSRKGVFLINDYSLQIAINNFMTTVEEFA